MAQDLKKIAADINADEAILNEPNLSDDQLFEVIDKLFKRDSQLVERATQSLTGCLSQLRAERAQLKQQQTLGQWAYSILASMLAWDQTSDLAQLDSQIRGLENLLSSL